MTIEEACKVAIFGLCAQAERDELKKKLDSIVHCRDCKHLYAKDMSAYCPHRVGPCSPDGFCDRGVQGG